VAEPAPRAGEPERREGGPRDDGEEGGEQRGRRRRGRRGGRGRGRRDGERPVADRGGDERRPSHAAEDRLPARRHDDDAGHAAAASAGDDEFASDLFARAPREEGAAGEPGDRPRESDRGDDEDRSRRRRRRGRRGGRGRSRREGQEPVTRRGPDEPDDEPLPSGYGVRPATRPADTTDRAAGDPPRATDDDSGERRGRRRRRGGKGRTTGREAASSGGSGRDRGRRADGDRRGGSTLSRGRRADFAPVAGNYDEDDEGLEFLGVEEAGREAPRREPHPEDDEILAESGLNTVRDVPSWVEAIGIVIAGNLDARSRRGGGGGDEERRRR
jgi:ribonuclease E